MKSKHLFVLAFVPLVLASCGNKGYAGVYSFQLGKASGAHATASMTLTDDPFYDETQQNLGKKMTLFGQMQAGPNAESSGTSLTSGDSQGGDIGMGDTGLLFDLFGTRLQEGVTIDGYYGIGADREQGRKQLLIGFDLKTLFGEDGPDIPPIDHNVIEQFVYCEIDSRKVYLQIPVSFTDLALQLYWYGTDMPWIAYLDGGIEGILGFAQLDGPNSSGSGQSSSGSGQSSSSSGQSSSQATSATGLSSLPPEVIVEHEPGTKPTQADIDKINETYPLYHEGKKFRMFYTISLALTRQ